MEVLALFGPTAVGKTSIAIAVADRLHDRGQKAVAVSADAIQVYRGLEVLSGAASPAEQARLETRLISWLGIDESCSAGAYAHRAHAEIDRLLAEGVVPIVVGGTGLYLRAALCELDLGPPPKPGTRERLLAEYDTLGAEVLHRRLGGLDPERAAAIAPADRHRVVRALELVAEGHRVASGAASGLWTTQPRVPTRLIGLTMDRTALVDRIEARVDAMVAAGAADEVREADAAGASQAVRKALGFAELLDGDVEAMKARTRRYAKRQMTWLRRLDSVELVDVTGLSAEQAAAEIVP